MNYTDEQAEAMYLDCFNNFLSRDAWRQHYQLGMTDGENILDRGRRLNHKRQLTNDNKLIAEFMGQEFEASAEEWEINRCLNNGRIEKPFVEHLDYDASWDWLMPVIKKCLVWEAEQNEEISNTTIKSIYEGICNQDISFAYKSVVQFIKAYNNGKQ